MQACLCPHAASRDEKGACGLPCETVSAVRSPVAKSHTYALSEVPVTAIGHWLRMPLIRFPADGASAFPPVGLWRHRVRPGPRIFVQEDESLKSIDAERHGQRAIFLGGIPKRII